MVKEIDRTTIIDTYNTEPESAAQAVAEEVTKSEGTVDPTPANTSAKLSSLKMVSLQGIEISDQCQNTLSDTYTNAIMGINSDETRVTYYLDGKYNTLTADHSVYENYWANETPYVFEIYTNKDENNAIYTTSLSRLSTVEHLSIDVSGRSSSRSGHALAVMIRDLHSYYSCLSNLMPESGLLKRKDGYRKNT